VVEAIIPLWSGFIGGHPMAGTAEQGIHAAQTQLFCQRPYVLTPTAQTQPQQLAHFLTLVEELGAQVLLCDPHAHDRAVAWISHLPIWVSAALLGAMRQESDPEIIALAQQLASSGWRDTTRVGGGNPELGVCLAHYNREHLLRGLYQYRQELNQVIAMIEQQDMTAAAIGTKRSNGTHKTTTSQPASRETAVPPWSITPRSPAMAIVVSQRLTPDFLSPRRRQSKAKEPPIKPKPTMPMCIERL